MGFWTARYLGPAQFGTLSYAMALVGIVSGVAELGLDNLVRRAVIQFPERADDWLKTAFALRLAGGAIGFALVLALVRSGWMSGPEQVLISVVGLTLFQPALFMPDLWFQARLEAKLSVQAQVVALVAGAAARIALIMREGPLVGFAWALVLEMLLGTVALGVQLRRRRPDRGGVWFDREIARRLLADAWPLLLAGFAVLLYLRMDAVMLRAMAGETAVGIYTAAARLTEIWFFVPTALAASVLPSLLRARERGVDAYARRLQGYYDANAGIAYAVAIPSSLAAPWLIELAYGISYREAGAVLALHVWSSVFVFLGVARGQFLVNEGHTRFYLAATVAGLLINVVLNLVLIPRAGAVGAAVATVLAQAVAAWLSSFCFAPTRTNGWMQTRALLIPFRWLPYVRCT
nr:flippase [Opitutus terrae]